MDVRNFLRSLSQKVQPKIFLSGSRSQNTIPVLLTEGEVGIEQEEDNIGGKAGLDLSLGDHRFGGSVGANYFRGALNFPQELQQYGAPSRQEYGTPGIQVNELSANYENLPTGLGVSGSYYPATGDYRVGARLTKRF
jgi:hypothetical protein